MTPHEQLAAYVGIVWSPDDLIEVRPLPAGTGQRRWIKAGSLPGMANTLTAENERGANLYVGVMPRKADGLGTDGDCLPGRVVWADFDHIDPFKAGDIAAAKGMPSPSLVINSGHGAHLYWRLTNLESPEAISRFVGDLAVYLGSDTTVKNPSRILRLPGFKNLKPPVATAELIHTKSAEYGLQLLRSILPKTPEPEPIKPTATPATGSNLIERARRYVATIPGATEGSRNKETFRVACLMMNDFALSFADAAGIVIGWNRSANSPPLDEKELQAVLDSAKKYAKKPSGNKVAHEYGKKNLVPSQEFRAELPAGATVLLEEFQAEGRGERRTVPLPWPNLQRQSQLLRPGTVAVIGGPPGFGKSLLALEILVYAHSQNIPWLLLPLEDRRVDVARRMLAHMERDWSIISTKEDESAARIESLRRHEVKLNSLLLNVAENPRLPVMGENGRMVVQKLPYTKILDWISNNMKRVMVIDPWAMIEFGEKAFKGEEEFLRQIIGMATEAGSTIIVVCHTVKRSGANGKIAITGEDLQGSALLRRIPHVVLILDHHDSMESNVFLSGGKTEKITHNKTILIDKVRNGPGKDKRIAFNMADAHFDELGMIAPKDKEPRVRKETKSWNDD